jgi:hypothetical protein
VRHISAVSEIISSLSLFCFCFCFLGGSVFVRKFPQTSTYQRSLKDNSLSLFILFLYFFRVLFLSENFRRLRHISAVSEKISSLFYFVSVFFWGFYFVRKLPQTSTVMPIYPYVPSTKVQFIHVFLSFLVFFCTRSQVVPYIPL